MLSVRHAIAPFCLLAFSLAAGCTTSEPYNVPVRTGSGGSTSDGGADRGSLTGTGGSTGTGGTGGGSGGSAGFDAGARDASNDAEVRPDGGGDTAPTFTQLYTEIFGVTTAASPSSCAGANCHNPGKSHEVDFASKTMAYSTLVPSKAMAGNPTGSPLMSRITSTAVGTRMPLNKPALSAATIARVRAWIIAGAKND